ncbi:flavin-containing monooxygenase [Spirillospora sp. CA-255316]
MSEVDGRAGASDQAGAERLRSALEAANIPTLLLVLAHLTGDERWLTEPYRPQRGEPLSDNDTGGLPEPLQREVREAAHQAILAHERGELDPAPIAVDRIAGMLSVTLGEDVPEEYGELLAEELALVPRDVDVPNPPDGFRVVIIGAGMSGICMAAKLETAGIDYVILEKDSDLGGTWLENVYPGCGVDTPSHFYSFSFAPNAGWSRYFPKRDEVWGYFSKVADSYGIRERIRFSTEVTGAEFDTARGTWRVHGRGADGAEFVLDTPVLVSAVGQVNRPSIPPIEGLDGFTGPVMHTARWRPEVDLDGKRVAVIGTGASAMQLVPAIADDAERVLVFQRTKQWAIPHPNYGREVPEGVRHLMSRVPLYARWYRLRTFWNFGDRLHDPLQIDPEWPHQDRSINAVNEKHRIFLTRHRAGVGGADRPARQLCAGLPAVREAPAAGQRVVPHGHPAGRRTDHGGGREGHRGQRGDRIRRGAPGRRDRAGDRVQDPAVPVADGDPRRRRPDAPRIVGRGRHACLPRRDGARVPELLRDQRPQHLRRARRQRDHRDRVRGALRDAGHPAPDRGGPRQHRRT